MRRRHRIPIPAALALGLALVLCARAEAEVFGDVFLGVAITGDNEFAVNGATLPPSFLCVQTCSSAKSPAGGIRIGYWFERFSWLGVAGDVSGFVPAWGIESPVNVDALAVSLVALFRLQLSPTDALPEGRFQPYVGIGPTLMTTFATYATGSNNPLYQPILGPLYTSSATSFDVGLDARVGARVLASDFISLFLEYRYTRASPTWNLTTPAGPASTSTTLATNQFNLGMGFHFR